MCTRRDRCGVKLAHAHPTSSQHTLLSLGSKQMQAILFKLQLTINFPIFEIKEDIGYLFKCKFWFLRLRDEASWLWIARLSQFCCPGGSRYSSALCGPPHSLPFPTSQWDRPSKPLLSLRSSSHPHHLSGPSLCPVQDPPQAPPLLLGPFSTLSRAYAWPLLCHHCSYTHICRVVLNHQNPWEGLWKCSLLGPTPRDSDSTGLGGP